MRKNWKAAMAFVTVIAAATTLFAGASADSAPSIKVNGADISTHCVLIDDRTYVPLRSFFEEIGASVSYNEASDTASIDMSLSDRDAILPGIIEKVSPCVVGIVGNLKPGATSIVTSYNRIAMGSGVIVKSGGEILTNAHVVQDLEKILVVLSDGSVNNAKIKAIDTETDLALIRIDKVGLPFADFADTSDIIVGKTVVAIGTPVSFSLRNSATTGIISGVNRGINTSYRLIQTDTPINPGNSGGPLINLNGKVVGINSSKFASTGVEGLCFSIPVDTVKYFINSVDKYGAIKRPKLYAEFEESWSALYGMPNNDGLKISTIKSGSPLIAAGVQEGWSIMKVAGNSIAGTIDLNEVFKSYIPGDTVQMVFTNSEGNEVACDIILAE